MDSTTNRLEDCELIFENFRVATMVKGATAYGVREDCVIGVRDGTIQWMGSSQEANPLPIHLPKINGNGRWLTPGLIDCHTHLVWAGNRADEWEKRLNGVSYETIAKQGGGIHSTVQATRSASHEELLESSARRLNNMIQQGVTTLEIKSGYGLDLETEVKMLQVAQQLGESFPVDIFRTFLGAHTVPKEFQQNPDAYVSQVCGPMLKAAQPLCHAVDVFCESIGFSVLASQRVLQSALDLGLDVKIHAEQLSNLGGTRMIAKLHHSRPETRALSADHIEYLDEEGCQALKQADMAAVLLPGAFYFIHERQKPPIEHLRNYDIPMAVATDLNPGSSPLTNILLATNLACTLFQLTPEEALAGVTRNAAKALGIADEVGTIEVGKKADFAIWDIDSPAELVYYIGHQPCRQVYKSGDLIFESPVSAISTRSL